MEGEAQSQPLKPRSFQQCLLHGTPVLFCKKNEDHDRYGCMFIQCRQWLDDCLACHPGRPWSQTAPPGGWPCTTPLDLDPYHSTFPSRLIDVGPAGKAPRLVKFDSLDQVLNASASVRYMGYVTLSYCWGTKSDHGHLLREENEAQFLQALPPLPRTIQDAVEVCRRIGVRFLWVDAICIIQGRAGASTDWEAESARVGSYYANALFTIAAAWAGGSDEGCLPDRAYYYHWKWIADRAYYSHWKWIYRIPQFLKTSPLRDDEYPGRRAADEQWFRAASENYSVLRKRGWTAQELALAQRILWLSPSGAVWSCRRENRGYWGAAPEYIDRLAIFQRNMKAEWYNFLVRYSVTELSYAEDRLPALSGICKYADTNASDQYLAGIWLSSLSYGLSWSLDLDLTRNAVTTCKDTSLPSWSPLATGQRIFYDKFYEACCTADTTCLKCGPGRLSLHKSYVNLRYSDIHGGIVSACLEIDATVYPVVVSSYVILSGISHRLKLETGMVLNGYLYLDDLQWNQNDRKEAEPARELYSVLLRHEGIIDARWRFQFLLLELAAEPTSYRRVGTFRSWDFDAKSSEAQIFQKVQRSSRIFLV